MIKFPATLLFFLLVGELRHGRNSIKSLKAWAE